MSVAAIDACCLIDLLASGHAEDILQASGLAWQLPRAVRSEVRYLRRVDPENAEEIVSTPVDLGPLLDAGILATCEPENDAEVEAFTRYAVHFRSDGEAMCLALAECRGWAVATDDRKAVRVAAESGLRVITSPELLKGWAESARPVRSVLIQAIRDIERLAQFRPTASFPGYEWWSELLGDP